MVLVVSASLAEIPPFFEPGAPPPTLPILLAQTEVGNIFSPLKLLAEEEIGPGPVMVCSLVKNRPTPYQKPSAARTGLPKPLPTTAVPDMESIDGDVDSDQDSESSDDGALIPKPNGEAGRPGRGGYNLEDALGWHAKEYSRFKVGFFF